MSLLYKDRIAIACVCYNNIEQLLAGVLNAACQHELAAG
jgi:hypothetical protein